MSEQGWNRTTDKLPPEGKIFLAIAPSGSVHRFLRKGALWFIGPTFDTYIYYSPEYWQALEEKQ